MFNGIQPRKYKEVLRCLNATVREYPRGAHIVELGEQSHNTGVLLDGTMEEFCMMKVAIKSASAVLSRRSIWCRTGLYWLDGKSGLSARQFGLYRNAAGFQRIDVTENADLSLPDAGHSKSYAGYGAAAPLFNTKVRILAQNDFEIV